jgi:hypothetical protein
MESNLLTIDMTFHGVASGSEPIGQSIELTLSSDGFHDPRGLGGSGEQPGPLSAEEAAAILTACFNRNDVSQLLARVEKLRQALDRASTI